MAEDNVSGLTRFGARLGHMLRFTRIMLCILIALVLAMLAWLVLAELAGEGVADPSPGIIPLLVVVFGTAMYGVAWWALIGFASGDESKSWEAGTPAAILVLAGIVALVLDVAIIAWLLS